jgi:hypothetical protein
MFFYFIFLLGVVLWLVGGSLLLVLIALAYFDWTESLHKTETRTAMAMTHGYGEVEASVILIDSITMESAVLLVLVLEGKRGDGYDSL